MSDQTVVLCYPATDTDVDEIKREFSGYSVCVSSQDRIAEDIMHADIFCGHAKVPIDWARVVSQGKLKWIQSSAAGLDHCLTPEVIDSSVLVSGCSGLFANQVAEQTMALLYALLRRLPRFAKAQEKREFVRRPTDELHGKTVGIVGFGGNGRRIAALLRGVAGKILATDVFDDFEVPDFVNLLPSRKIELLFAESDIVIVTLPLTNQTVSYIDKRHFESMRKGVYFINVARGAVVDQNELANAIEDGTIGFAGLDVVDPEPLPEHSPLWSFENVIITPHVGAQSETRLPWTKELFCLNKTRFLNAETLINEVDKELQFPRPEHRIRIGLDGQPLWPKVT